MTALIARIPQSAEMDHCLSFMVVELNSDADPAAIQSLTPRVMQWSDNTWILDLRSCRAYWQAQAERRETSLTELWRQLLTEVAGDSFRATLADHPWPGVLLLAGMRERKLTGLIAGSGAFGQNIFRDLSWDAFWNAADRIGEHFDNWGRTRFRPERYRSQRDTMRRAMQRLGIKRPWQLRDVEATAIKRRFGKTIQDLWQWAYAPKAADDHEQGLFAQTENEHLFTSGFPWQSFAFAEPPHVTRHLDYPLCEWSHIEPVLGEDFDRLCSLATWQAGERVVSLEWRIVFRDLTHLSIPILFRHPHSLHNEKTRHGTALLQALYAFENAVPGSPLDAWRFGKDDPAVPIVPIISWQLTITERLTQPPTSLGIFGDVASADTETMEILNMENRLAVDLERFDMREDWLPEDSYRLAKDKELYAAGERSQRYSEGDSEDPGALPSLVALASTRPLFLLRKPKLLNQEGRSCAWQFAERTMEKWWRPRTDSTGAEAEGRALQRDYYRVTGGDQKTYWVYRDSVNPDQSFIHGVYG